MSEDVGSLYMIARDAWYQYDGDAELLKTLDADESYSKIHDVLKKNYIDGFLAGFKLRLTGESDGR